MCEAWVPGKWDWGWLLGGRRPRPAIRHILPRQPRGIPTQKPKHTQAQKRTRLQLATWGQCPPFPALGCLRGWKVRDKTKVAHAGTMIREKLPFNGRSWGGQGPVLAVLHQKPDQTRQNQNGGCHGRKSLAKLEEKVGHPVSCPK